MNIIKNGVKNNVLFSEIGIGAGATHGFGLGIIVGIGLALSLISESLVGLGLYLIFLACFHYTEFICVAMFNATACYNSCNYTIIILIED